MNKKLLTASILLVAGVIPVAAMANEGHDQSSPAASLTATTETRTLKSEAVKKAAELKDTSTVKAAEIKSTIVAKLEEKADREISRRLTSLEKLITKINESKKLSAESKTALIADVQAEIENLETLQTEIEADTTIEDLRTDVKAIKDSHRVYALYIPKMHIVINADRSLETAGKLTTLAGKLETSIDTARASGKDVSALDSALKEMKTSITEAEKQAKTAQDAVLGLKAADFPGNKTSLQAGRTAVRAAHQALKTARLHSRTIINGLKPAASPSAEASPASSPAPSPTVSQ